MTMPPPPPDGLDPAAVSLPTPGRAGYHSALTLPRGVTVTEVMAKRTLQARKLRAPVVTRPGPPPEGLFEETPRRRAVWSLQEAVRAAAREVFDAAVVERPLPGLSVPDGDVESTSGLRAAVLARDVAAGCLRYYAERARAEGRSWDDVAEALGVAQDGAGQWSRAELAYRHLVEGRAPHPDEVQPWRSQLGWRCACCGQRVTDRGPFEAAPDDNEGHAPNCARHAAEAAAYRAGRGE